MSVAQLIAIKFELAYLAKHSRDPRQRARLLMKLAAIDAQIKAAPPLGWRKAA